MQKASPELMRAWARLLRVQQRLTTAVERDLKQADALPLDWYDALLELERAPDGRLSPGELESNMLIAQYSLSRLVDRLERDGLIRRLPHPEDGRRQLLEITARGRKRRAASWPAYAEAVNRHAGGRLDESELQALQGLLEKLL
jgi:DNA-binding MarR family transcriptional regulator